MEFFTSEVFKLGSVSVTGWMLVAAIAVVVLLVVIIAVSAAAGKKKKKAAAAKSATENNAAPVIDNKEQEDAKSAVEKTEKSEDIQEQPIKEEIIDETPEEEAVPVEDAKTEAVAAEHVKETEQPIDNHVKKDEQIEETKAEEAPVKESKPAPIVKAVRRSDAEDEIAAANSNSDNKKLSPKKQGLVEINMSKTVKETKKQTTKTEVTKAAKPTVKPATQTKDKTASQKIIVISGDAKDTFGKYYIIPSNSAVRPYKFCLKANNGQLMFESEPYKAKPKLASINAFKKHCANGIFEVDEDKAGSFRYKLYSKDGTLIGVGESYSTKAACEKSVESVKKFADSATVIEDTTIEE